MSLWWWQHGPGKTLTGTEGAPLVFTDRRGTFVGHIEAFEFFEDDLDEPEDFTVDDGVDV